MTATGPRRLNEFEQAIVTPPWRCGCTFQPIRETTQPGDRCHTYTPDADPVQVTHGATVTVCPKCGTQKP